MARTPRIESFLAARIDSVETLVILLLFARGKALRSAEGIGETLGLEPHPLRRRVPPAGLDRVIASTSSVGDAVYLLRAFAFVLVLDKNRR